MGTDGGHKFSLPPRFESLKELRQSVLELYDDEIIETAGFHGADSTTKVAIIDSLFDPGPEFKAGGKIKRQVDLLPASAERVNGDGEDDLDDTTGHGWIVLNLINHTSINGEYYLYRVIQSAEGGKAWGRHIIKAIGKAHLEDKVDIIHLSLGTDHSTDGNTDCPSNRQPCRLRYAANQAIDDGVIIVGSAGNNDQYNSICCPSLSESAISVGGFVAKCTKRLEVDDVMSLGGIETKPPQACWLESDDPKHVDDIYCSGLDCSPFDKCDNYRRIRPWSGNVEPAFGKPDVLGPAMFPVVWGRPQLTLGTSWAAAYVTAGMLEIIAGMRDEGFSVNPQLLRKSVIAGSFDIEGSDAGGYSYRRTAIEVAKEFGLKYEYDTKSHSLFRGNGV